MFGSFLTGTRPKRVHAILAKDAPLSRMDSCEARDGLLVQLFTTNGKRSGDLANLERSDLQRAQTAGPEPTELKIYDHKEARSGKECPLLVTTSLIQDLRAYVAKGSIDGGLEQIFTTDKGKKLSSTTMAVKREWQKHAINIGKVLPPLTATLCRKMAVSPLRDAGGDRQQQRVLAKHIAHNPRTADIMIERARRRRESASGRKSTNFTRCLASPQIMTPQTLTVTSRLRRQEHPLSATATAPFLLHLTIIIGRGHVFREQSLSPAPLHHTT
ncbi:uncharacterized protein LOC110453180 [Mizuhopecten yessoensis]|nr:uncharacterized protein LOC110453180 [Mizuhopecten yessoensis]